MAELAQCTRDLLPRAEKPDEVAKQLAQVAMMKGFDARTDGIREKARPPGAVPSTPLVRWLLPIRQSALSVARAALWTSKVTRGLRM